MKFFLNDEEIGFTDARAYCERSKDLTTWFVALLASGHGPQCDCEFVLMPFGEPHLEDAMVAVARIDVADLLARPTVPE